MRWPPNQSVAMLANWMTRITEGNMKAIRRPTPRPTTKRSSFAAAKRSPLEVVADEGADNAHAGDLLAQHLVDPVDAELHRAEQRAHPRDEQHDDGGEERDEDEKERRERHVLVERQDDAADAR